MIFFPILFPFPLLAISLPLPFFASQFDFLVVKSSYCVENSLHCILKNKVVWCGFLFGFFITLNDKIKILPWKGSNYFIALVQLPPRFFFFTEWISHSSDEECKHPYMELLSEEYNKTMVCYELCYLPFLFTSLLWRRTVLFDSTSVSRCSLGRECAGKGNKQKRTLLIP